MNATIKSLLVLLAGLMACSALAQNPSDRSQWMNEMAQYRRTFFVKELDLNRDQENRFFPLYEEMDEQTRKLDEDTRVMERRVSDAADATDVEYEKAAEAIYDAKVQQASLEREYLAKFKEILTPKQMFELKRVERRFSRELIRQHHRIRSTRNAGNK